MFYLYEPIKHAYLLGSLTIIFSNLLDLTIDKETLIIYLQKNTDLYIEGLLSVYLNLLLVAGMNYIIAYNYLLDLSNNDIYLFKYGGLLLTHNILYYTMHYMVHKINSIRFIHKFHHLFKTNIPSIGNAVSYLEFQIMYVLPFLVGMFIFQPNPITIDSSIITISILNAIIHSSKLKNMNWISIFVSPKQHSIHHETYENHYAAPLLNFDKFLNNVKKHH